MRLLLNTGSTSATVAGNGRDSLTTPGLATTAGMGSPRGLIYDAAGNLYIADSRNHVVTRTTPAGVLSILAGTGRQGFSGDGGPATQASLNSPASLALRNDGSLLIADTGNHRVRSISPSGVITTVAGDGAAGNTGDGGSALTARLRTPSGLAVDAGGNVLIADTGNHRIRKITPSGSMVSVAGTGQEGDGGDGGLAFAATFRKPVSLLPLPNGDVLVADEGAGRVRVLHTDGTVAAYSTPMLRRPEGLAADPAGNVLVADAALQQVLQSAATGYAVLAGSGKQGAATSGPAHNTALDSPSAATPDSNGGVAISDRRNHQVQHIALPSLSFGDVPAGQSSSPQDIVLQNAGTEALTVTSFVLPTGFEATHDGSCAAPPVTLAPAGQCTLALVFRPTAQGQAGALGVVAVSNGPAAMILLSGNATAAADLAASSTALASNGTISYSGAPILFTATVTGALLPVPVGSVSFQDGSTTLASVPLASGQATFSTAALPLGQHMLHASYSGDAVYAASMSANVSQAVVAAPDFSLTASAISYSGKSSAAMTIPLTLTPLNGSLNHAVTLAVSGLPAGATSDFLPATLTLGGDPAAVLLKITVPATAASTSALPTGLLAAALLFAALPLRRRRSTAILCLAGMTCVTFSGCGGGFRTVTNPTGSGPGAPKRYNITVTAGTSGVLGDTLTHSIPLEIDITP